MKKAYQWREEQIKRGLKGDVLSMEMDLELIPFFKQIQIDAYKAGMQAAADMIDGSDDENMIEAYNSIRLAAQNFTKESLEAL